MHLKGTSTFITGAAQGLGKAFAEALLRKGARVCLSDVQLSKGRQVTDEFQKSFGKDNVMFEHCDVASEESFTSAFRNAVSKLGHISLMVNNAGIADESKPLKMMAVNLGGAIQGTRLAEAHMRKDRGGKGGTIINVASTAGLIPVYLMTYYVASKHGVVGMHKSLSRSPHVKEKGIQYGCLCPAFTDTEMIQFKHNGMQVDNIDEAKVIMGGIGINRVEDVVKGFLQLVDSDDCNGHILTVTANEGIQYAQRSNRQSRL